jgi:hypothetical protein
VSVAELRETVAGVGGTLYLHDGHLHLRLPRESRPPAACAKRCARIETRSLRTSLGQAYGENLMPSS